MAKRRKKKVILATGTRQLIGSVSAYGNGAQVQINGLTLTNSSGRTRTLGPTMIFPATNGRLAGITLTTYGLIAWNSLGASEKVNVIELTHDTESLLAAIQRLGPTCLWTVYIGGYDNMGGVDFRCVQDPQSFAIFTGPYSPACLSNVDTASAQMYYGRPPADHEAYLKSQGYIMRNPVGAEMVTAALDTYE